MLITMHQKPLKNQCSHKTLIGKRGVNSTKDPEIPKPEEFKTASYLDSLLKKGVRYRKQVHLLMMLITRTMETGGVTLLKNENVKNSFKYLYNIDVSERQICNLLKKLENDKQIHIKIQTLRTFENGKPVFKKKRFVYVWASYFANNCKIDGKLSRYSKISTLEANTEKLPLKYKIKKPLEIFSHKNKKSVTVAPYISSDKDVVNNGILPKWFKYGIDSSGDPNFKKVLIWGYDDIKAYRNQNILEFVRYMGHSPDTRKKQRKKELFKFLKTPNNRRQYELVSNK